MAAPQAATWAVVSSPQLINNVKPTALHYVKPTAGVQTGQDILVLAFPYPWLPAPIPWVCPSQAMCTTC